MLHPKAIINLDNLKNNIKYIKSLLHTSILYPVIKANAYGHGATHVAQILKKESIEGICVATYDEVVEILNLNLNLNILHLGKIILNSNIINNKVIFTINSYDDVKYIDKICQKSNQSIRCHIKVDTGMNRMGCKMIEFEKVFFAAHKSKYIILEAVYSHLACANNKNSANNKTQILEFEYIRNLTKKYDIKYHLLNSSGIFNYPKCQYDYIRIGLSIYGVSPLGKIDVNLKPVMQLVAPVVLEKVIQKGEHVGYGCTFTAQKKMRIAIVQCGYADGLPIDFGNKGFVFFNKFKLPIIGKVSMDLICIDISDLNNTDSLNEVIVWGGDQDDSKLEILAKKFHTIPYSFLTGISNRVKRIYYEN